MYKFNCYECKYKTNLKGDYKRHLNSKKHQRNMTNDSVDCVECENTLKEYTKSTEKVQKSTQMPFLSTQKVHKKYTNNKLIEKLSNNSSSLAFNYSWEERSKKVINKVMDLNE